jgi:superfamily I DNA/RNA helicase
VLNYHQLLRALNTKAGISDEVIDDWNEFNLEVEDRTLYALHTIQSRCETFEPYDYLVLDEAQDLMTAQFLGSLELLLRGGWDHGAWTVCIDPRQAIFHRQYDSEQFERLRRIASLCPLNLNCRNTREVAAYSHGLSGIEGIPTRKARGPATEIVWFPDSRQYLTRLRKTVNQLIESIADLKRESRDIAVLSTSMARLPDEIKKVGFFSRPVVEAGTIVDCDVVQVGTLQSFKGLEAMAVVLVGIEELESPGSRQLAYVGGSRAKSFLRIMLPDYLQESVQQRLPEILSLLGQ